MKALASSPVVKIALAFFALILTVIIFMPFWPKKIDVDNGQTKIQPGDKQEGSQSSAVTYKDLVKISFPGIGEKVGGEINVTGIARGAWYFEGEFPIELIDAAGKKLASGAAMAQGEWMTDDFVPFSATITYRVSEPIEAKLIIKRNNPSDIREQDAEFEIPVFLEPELATAKIFFASRHVDRYVSVCDKVFPAAREGFETMAFSYQAVEELLKGTTVQEDNLGYYSAVPEGVKIQQFDILGKTAKIDLSKELLNMDIDVACRRILMKKQIVETVKSSSDAESVVITVDGKSFPGEFPDEGPKIK